MKLLLATLIFGTFATVFVHSAAHVTQVDLACIADARRCTSRFSGYKHVASNIADITSHLLDQSFDFLILSMAFKQHDRNRPGFERLYRKISDQAWSDALDTMQYQSKRGFPATLSGGYKYATSDLRSVADPSNATEHGSLQLAMEYEKLVTSVAHSIHRKMSGTHQQAYQYDADVAHFLDEKLISGRSDTVRKLTGHIHILEGILNAESDEFSRDMGLQMFDQYLKTVE
ncbi:soma ferritin-like [Toxorhynchites rutilus septentrionalis]|uniref:soma ferritin-like n=1 Tax=Toxorhynchites rutilus septentrionalis TaxID=329112 RepID=UPI00247AD830|nr:soma ferritin-like [Toxorhynchites rutilus septentrionalis]